MFKDIDADCYLMVDGDNTYSAKNAKEMCNYVLEGKADMVIGDKLVRGLINKLFKTNLRDIMTGYRAFSYNFVKTFPILSKGFEIETEMTIHALDKNLLIKEIPIQYRDRPEGSKSKLNTYKDGYRVLKTIARLFKEYKPMVFFSMVATIFFLISIGFGIPIFVEYFDTGLVRRFPTLIFSGFMLMISILMLMCGVILEVMAKKHRQIFEYMYINLKREK